MSKDTIKNDWDIKLKHTRKRNLKTPLPKNTDSFTLVINKKKTTFEVTNNNEYYKYVEACAKAYKEQASLMNQGKTPKFNDIDAYKLFTIYDIIRILPTPIKVGTKTKFQISYWTKDYDSTSKLYMPANLEALINIINDVFEITNFSGLMANIKAKLLSIVPEYNKFKHLNLAPSHITLFNNGVLNTKELEFSSNVDEFGEFEFISKINHSFLSPDLVNQAHYQLVNKLFHDWTDDGEEKIVMLKQLAVAVIDGDGRNVYIIILGAGGNGKSIYLNMLTKLASGYHIYFDMQDIYDDNKINEIRESTKLIVGHELATNAKFSGNMISRIKKLATADPIKANVKYEDAVDVATKCVKIQATNSLPKIFENNQAILRRIKLFKWTDKDFSKLETNIDLDSLIEDSEFIEAFISYAFTGIEPFKRFVTIKSVEEDSANAVNDADQVYQFLSYLKEQDLLVGKLPNNVVYQMYLSWNKTENPGSRPLKSKELVYRLKNHFAEFNLEISEKQSRASSLKPIEFNFEVLNSFFYNYQLSINKYTMTNYIETNNYITEDDLLEVQMKLGTYELEPEYFYDYKNMMILKELIRRGDADAIGMNEMIEDLK